uniref:(California timema) hypothetical protein n=1 Tax=Timema californicum TaxID=61474 RepID=A0A7R9IVX0_TIMCA|nr:unnamed protein product [Timema californicum]
MDKRPALYNLNLQYYHKDIAKLCEEVGIYIKAPNFVSQHRTMSSSLHPNVWQVGENTNTEDNDSFMEVYEVEEQHNDYSGQTTQFTIDGVNIIFKHIFITLIPPDLFPRESTCEKKRGVKVCLTALKFLHIVIRKYCVSVQMLNSSEGTMCWKCFDCFRAQVEDVQLLDYQHCMLNDVPVEVFTYERTLEELYLQSNRIRDLPRPLFHCHGLKTLSLSDNDILNLPPAIASLINLRRLDLSKNDECTGQIFLAGWMWLGGCEFANLDLVTVTICSGIMTLTDSQRLLGEVDMIYWRIDQCAIMLYVPLISNTTNSFPDKHKQHHFIELARQAAMLYSLSLCS